MILFLLPLFALAGRILIGLGAQYLFNLLFPPVPSTTPLSQPYTPPFTGGQCCDANYRVNIQFTNVYNQVTTTYVSGLGKVVQLELAADGGGGTNIGVIFQRCDLSFYTRPAASSQILSASITSVVRIDGRADNCGDLANPNPSTPIGSGGLAQSPPPVLYPPPNNPNNNWFSLIAGTAAVAAAAMTAATVAAMTASATAVVAGTAAVTAATAAIASAPSGSTTQQQSQSQKSSGESLVAIGQAVAEIAKQIEAVEKEVRKAKTKESKKEEDDAKKVIRYDFGSASRDGFVTLYPESNPDGYEATFIDVRVFNLPSAFGKYFGEKSPHYYRYKSLGQIHFVSPTLGILESREIDFARLSLNVPDNCFGFFYHFGLDGIISANMSGFYTKVEKQAV